MSDLISRKALLEELKNTYVPVSVKLIDIITNAPSIEQGEPVAWQFYQDGKWHYGANTNNHKQNTIDGGFPVRELYTTSPQPQTVKDVLEIAANADSASDNKLIERVITLLKESAWDDGIIDMRVDDLIEDVRALKGK